MKFRVFFILLNFFISSSFCLAQNYIVGGSFDYGDLREEWEFENIYQYASKYPDRCCIGMLDIWNLDKDPYEGNCFALLVVRDDGSNENMIQKLRFPLRKGIQYEMSFYLAWADDMESVSPESRDMKVDFGNPLDLKFWISKKKKKSLLIYEAEQVKSIDWERHSIIITPDTDINYFWIESAHSPNIGFSYNGNILIDQIQIIKVD